jgi:hypothetical protein
MAFLEAHKAKLEQGLCFSPCGLAQPRCKEVIDGERRRRNMRPRQELLLVSS